LSPHSTPVVRQLFGTDGIRGVAGEYPLDRRTVLAIGRALGARLKRRISQPRILIGQDTRESSGWIAEALAEGLKGAGAEFVSAGVIPTPGVAYLTRSEGYDVGVVISASHNPWQDNGIKLFGGDGKKLADELEHAIEQDIFAHIEELAGATPDEDLSAAVLPGEEKLRADFRDWLGSNVAADSLKGLRVLVDCANGAASSIAPPLFAALGIEAEFVHVSPDGRNINNGCGALHPDKLGERIAAAPGKYDLGVTFDGDADRALFCDGAGKVVDGDAVLYLGALDLKARGRLRGDTVVATIMSNMGLEKALEREQIKLLRAKVGDKYVLEQMQTSGAVLGGEQSGHILFLDGESTTGDGVLTALRIFEIVARSGKSIAELLTGFTVYPQMLKNIKVRERIPFAEIPEVAAAMAESDRELGDTGRTLVRYSGTEKLCRVMVEAACPEVTQRCVERIAAAIEKTIGL